MLRDVPAAMSAHSDTTSASQRTQSLLLLRWVLIVATSYLILFSQPLSQLPPSSALFIAAYFASNLVLGVVLPRVPSQPACDVAVVLLDVVMVAIGLVLTPTASSEFFVVYFVVVFMSALSERLGLVVAAALLVSATHLYTMSHFIGWGQLLGGGYPLRVPFVFVVALFFGHLVSDARSRDRQVEEARRREMRLKFLSSVMHDLKNSLGVTQSLATLLLDEEAGALNPEQADFVRRIHATTRHVITFALNLIDAERIEAGQLSLYRRPISAADIVEDALLLARSASDLKGITLSCAVQPGLPPLHVDAVQMERVISNLVGNAIKFTPAGGSVRLSVHRAGENAVLEVRDDGTGIPPAELLTLFDRRQRNGNGPMQGSGLGLSIVKAIVQAHDGQVGIASTLGNGTTVTVQLPLQPPTPARAPSPAPVPPRWWKLSPSIGSIAE